MDHTHYMRIALELAEKGTGFTHPNPLVGALIVKNGTIIAQGYHAEYGGPHAEIDAFNNATESVKDATMYVTLEPCSHYGKTPPCADAIIAKGIKKVIIASKDPNPLVSGNGITKLEKAGITVETGILDDENQTLNAVFFHYIKHKTPYVMLKTAMSADGKIATKSHDSKWISNEKSRKFVHELRHAVQAIMVGAGTIIHDNPRLTTRLDKKRLSHPIRIIVDTEGVMPIESNVLNLDVGKTLVVTTNLAPEDKVTAFKEKGADVIFVNHNDGDIDLVALMKILAQRQIDSILLEGGATLNDAAIRNGIVNRVYSFIAPLIIGGRDALSPVGGEGFLTIKEAAKLRRIDLLTFDDDVLVVYEMRDG